MPAHAWFLILVGGLAIIFVHEAGHFLVARWCGYPIPRVSVGFGPTIVRHTDRRGTCWALSILPFGGYVKIQTDEVPCITPQQGLAWTSALGRRAAIWAAGPLANLILCGCICGFSAIAFGHAGLVPSPDSGLPAALASLLAGFSLAMAAFNLLPLPPLDGGALALIAIEAVTRKPMPEAAQRSFRRVGLAAILTAIFLSLIYVVAPLPPLS
jgi:membrane-associated protease RseP (regulator of RpoE activity)